MDGRVVGQRDADQGVRRHLAEQGGGHVEYRVGAVAVRDRDDHLAGPHDLAGLRAGGDHRTRRVRQQLRVAELVFGRVQLGRVGIDLGLGAEKRLLRGIELDPGGPTLANQRPLALQVVSGFMEGGLRRGKRGLRGTQGVLLRLRVEFGNEIAWLDNRPHIDLARDHPAVDAEGEAFLRARPDMAGERYRFPLCVRG